MSPLATPEPVFALAARAGPARPQVIAWGQQGRVWDFVPPALALLRAQPADEQLRLVLVMAYARLGLRTPAMEQLELAPNAPDSLRKAVVQLPDDRVPLASRVDSALAGVRELVGSRPQLQACFQAWSAHAGRQEWLRCNDGNMVRREIGATDSWTRFSDERRAARSPIPAVEPMGELLGPIYLEGVDPPWLLQRLAAERPVGADGYQPRLVAVVESPWEVLDALAYPGAIELLSQERVELVLGPDAPSELARRLAGRMKWQLGCVCLSLPGVPPGAGSPGRSTQDVLKASLKRQEAEAQRAIAAVAARYATRDRAWWRRRYEQARSPQGPPLRVMIPTTRYSTYLQHASADIAEAFRAAGCEARLIIEPDSSSLPLRWAPAADIEEFDPDLILLLNYPRAHMAGVVPENVPFVCWVQDAMGHLFDPKQGACQGPLDLLVGHLLPELMASVSHARSRAMALPVLASAAKFHHRPVDSALRRRHECEIAIITHQSQPPEVHKAQLLASLPVGSPPALLLEDLYPVVLDLAARAIEQDTSIALRRAVEFAVQARGMTLSEGLIGRVLNQICRPLADRALRHQTVAWAAQIARDRGWRLHLYGRGWEQRPQFAPFAKGELPHGEALRAAYQCASVTLHASISWNLHQRVAECALSGGLPLCRLKLEDVASLEAHVSASIAHRLGPAAAAGAEEIEVPTADAPEAMALVACLQRLGVVDRVTQGHRRLDPGSFRLSRRLLADPWCYWDHTPFPLELAWIHGDPAESMFWDQQSLEAAVVKATTMPRWREELSKGMARRARAWLTYEGAAPRICERMRRVLELPALERSG